MKLKDLLNTKSAAFPWFMLGLVYLLCNIFFIGTARYEFPYGLIYIASFLGIAGLLVGSKPSFISGLIVALEGVLVFIVQGLVITFDSNSIWAMAVISLLATALVYASQAGMIHFKTKTEFKYMTFVPMILMITWGVIYFYGRMVLLPGTMTTSTMIDHAGIILVSFASLLQISGTAKSSSRYLMWIGLLLAVVGAVWLTGIDHWGLQLIR